MYIQCPRPEDERRAREEQLLVGAVVEAAAEWAVYAGAAMHGCREVMGPNGNAGWPGNAGSPGRGGERWKGVDGYDAGRWRLWKETCGAIAMEEGAARPYRFT